MALINDYYIAGQKHVCMFCGTTMAALKDGKLKPLGNKAHVYLSKTKEGLYVVNCCKECVKSVNFKDQQLLDIVHENVLQCKLQLDLSSGKTQEEAQALYDSRNEDKPLVGFLHIDHISRSSALDAYKKYLKQQG